ncbi:MAG: polysaccharide biosynthesis protein, partial [Marinomonas sp.]
MRLDEWKETQSGLGKWLSIQLIGSKRSEFAIYTLVFNFLTWLAALPRRVKQAIILSLDVFLLLQAAWISYSLRIGVFTYWNESVAKIIALTLPTAVILFVATGVYSTIFRYAGLGMMRRLVRTFVLYSFVITIAITVGGISGIPRTLGVLQPLVFFAFVMGARIAIRFVIVELLGRHTFSGKVKRVLIYGAGNAGQQIASSLRTEPEINVVGFVDDDKQKSRQSLDGTSIWWSGDIAQIISEKKVTDIFLAIPSTSRRKRRKIIEGLGEFKVIVQTLPQVRDLAQGSVSIDDVRPVEIEDLLGREPVAPDKGLLGRTVLGKTVMVTGAGGSIGSELCRQIASIGAAKLILFEISEFSLYKIEHELRQSQADDQTAALEIVPILGSVVDRQKLDEVFAQNAIDTVFHAAAYKHVPLVEANPIEAIRNNTIGTQELSGAAAA